MLGQDGMVSARGVQIYLAAVTVLLLHEVSPSSHVGPLGSIRSELRG